MPLHIEELTSEVTVAEGDLPMTPAQVDKLVQIVMRRIDERDRQRSKMREATEVKRSVLDAFDAGVPSG